MAAPDKSLKYSFYGTYSHTLLHILSLLGTVLELSSGTNNNMQNFGANSSADMAKYINEARHNHPAVIEMILKLVAEFAATQKLIDAAITKLEKDAALGTSALVTVGLKDAEKQHSTILTAADLEKKIGIINQHIDKLKQNKELLTADGKNALCSIAENFSRVAQEIYNDFVTKVFQQIEAKV